VAMMLKNIFLLLLFALAACSTKAPEKGHKKPLLLVSLAPYQTLVQKIAGEEFEVQTIVPSHADPHNYEPRSNQLPQMAEGKIWFQIGESFERKLRPLLKDIKTLDLREDLPMIEGHCKHCASEDRHLWLSPKLMMIQAKRVSHILTEVFPEKKEAFEKRLIVLNQELEELDLEIETRLHSVKNRIFLVSHPAFLYFCRDYNCTQLSIEHEGKEPRPKELEETLKAAIEQNAAFALSLPQHNNKGAQLIAEKLHIPVRFIDPYAADYVDTMRKLSELIADERR
jgi:zinc transport system substrate-binding protein